MVWDAGCGMRDAGCGVRQILCHTEASPNFFIGQKEGNDIEISPCVLRSERPAYFSLAFRLETVNNMVSGLKAWHKKCNCINNSIL